MNMIREAGIIEDWIADGEARGEARGAARGRIKQARSLLLRVGAKRFGEPDAAIRTAIEEMSHLEMLDRLLMETLDVESWRALLDPRA